MPTFRENTKLGTNVVLIKTDDLDNQIVTTEKVKDKAITKEKLADGSVSTQELVDGSVVNSKLADSSVTTSKIADGNVTTSKIADSSVDNSKIAPTSVTTDKLADGSVVNTKIAENSISNGKLQDGSIDERNIQDDAVTTSKIADKNVTTEKLSEQSVINSKLAEGAVTNNKIADDTLTLNKFDADLRDALKAATGLPDDLLQKVQDLTENVAELQDSEFPIVPSLSAAFDGNDTVKITYTVSCKGEPFVPDTLELRSNNTLLSNVPASSGTASTTIPSVIHGISLKVGKQGRTSKTASIVRYLVFHGASAVESADEEFIKKTLKKAYVAIISSLNLRVDTKDGEYIWLVFPHDVTINRVTSGGFDVSLERPLHIDTELGAVHAYRTTNKLTAQTWNLVIS